jgi:uncharacterized membrane protein YhaH (DUF805 family)
MDMIIQCLTKKYAQFSGRASRKEFWLFVLFYMIVYIILTILDTTLYTIHPGSGIGYMSGIFWLATIIPYIAVSVRRLHDTNRVGWWLLVAFIPIIGPIVLLVFFCSRGVETENRFS